MKLNDSAPVTSSGLYPRILSSTLDSRAKSEADCQHYKFGILCVLWMQMRTVLIPELVDAFSGDLHGSNQQDNLGILTLMF